MGAVMHKHANDNLSVSFEHNQCIVHHTTGIEVFNEVLAAKGFIDEYYTPSTKRLGAMTPCEKHDWQDMGLIRDGYNRGYGIVAYRYECSVCGETMEIEKDVL